MNIISNNCFGGFLYKYAGMKYENPFIWTAINGSSLLEILFNYDSIDFSKIFLHDVSGHHSYNLVIDDKLDVKFWSHHKYDSNAQVPYKNGDSIFSADIGKYILDTYSKRLARMKETPVFAIYWWKGYGPGTPDYFRGDIPTDDKKWFEEIINHDFKYKTVILHPYKEYDNYRKQNLICLYDENCEFPTRSPAAAAKLRYEEILKIFNESEI